MSVKFLEEVSWRKSDKEYFLLLCEDLEFQDIINRARTKLRLREDNLPSAFESARIYRESEQYADFIIDTFELADSWKEPLRLFIVTGTISPSGLGIYISGFAKRFNPIARKFLYSPKFSISVTEKMGYTNLLKLIEKNKEKIKEHLEKLPRRRSRIKNIDMALDIKKLLNEKRSIKDILDYLGNKYGDSLPDESTLRVQIKRINQRLKGQEIT